MIPKIIHFIFGLSPDFGGKPFSYIHYLAVKTAKIVHKPEEIYFHYQFEPSGKWWNETKGMVLCKHFIAKDRIFGNALTHFAHKTDVARLEILQEYGGIYLDTDVISINSFDPLLKYEFVMGMEENVGLCNAVILANKDSSFLRTWYNLYKSFDGRAWNEHSVKLPLRLAKGKPDLIHIEDEYSFFYPMYNDPTALYLWNTNVNFSMKQKVIGILRKVKCSIHSGHRSINLLTVFHVLFGVKWQYKTLQKSYCLHLWESVWWNEYLNELSPEKIKNMDSNFMKIIRKILSKNDI